MLSSISYIDIVTARAAAREREFHSWPTAPSSPPSLLPAPPRLPPTPSLSPSHPLPPSLPPSIPHFSLPHSLPLTFPLPASLYLSLSLTSSSRLLPTLPVFSPSLPPSLPPSHSASFPLSLSTPFSPLPNTPYLTHTNCLSDTNDKSTVTGLNEWHKAPESGDAFVAVRMVHNIREGSKSLQVGQDKMSALQRPPAGSLSYRQLDDRREIAQVAQTAAEQVSLSACFSYLIRNITSLLVPQDFHMLQSVTSFCNDLCLLSM